MKVRLELDVECDENLTEEQVQYAVLDMLNDPRWRKGPFAIGPDGEEIFINVRGNDEPAKIIE